MRGNLPFIRNDSVTHTCGLTIYVKEGLNPLCINPIKWSNTLKQIADELFECV